MKRKVVLASYRDKDGSLRDCWCGKMKGALISHFCRLVLGDYSAVIIANPREEVETKETGAIRIKVIAGKKNNT